MNALADIDPTFVLLNRVEAGFWVAMAAVLFVGAIRSQPIGRSRIIAAGALVAFGVSDWVETTTGAWWRPWWLLAWKATCVLILLILLIQRARCLKRLNPRTANSAASSPSRRSPEA